MASQTRPFLMTGAALASALAVVAATPAITPSITASSLRVSTSGVNLATFSDIFTIPSSEWTASYFQGYGGIVGPNNPLPVQPWASQCDTKTGPGCYVAGLSGPVYLALDALINGNGKGWTDNANWGVGAVNYFFEGGLPAGSEYLLQASVGAANPALSVLITLLYSGPQLVTVVYDNALQLLSSAALNVPLVGQYVYGALNAYLGPASLDTNFQGYTQGLSGVLNYAIDVLTGNAPPVPTATTTTPTSAAAVAPVAAAAALVGRAAQAVAPAADVPAADATATAAATAPSAADAVKDASKAGASKDATPAAETGTETGTASTAATTTAATTEATPAVDSPAGAVADTSASAASAASSTDTKPADSPVKTRKRPVRDAVEKVTKSIGSALKGDKADAAS